MALFRILGLLVALIVGSSLIAWLASGETRYLTLAKRVGIGALLAALLFMLLLAAERLLHT
ncbi:MAG TPA: hypothetical protein VJ001_04095 [Rhodocyclaceae bacterium]|nr:hypothetical protein [Rhodocyclaceae bacterium]